MNELDLGPLRVEAEENPGSSVAVLLAEVVRLRADLTERRRRFEAIYDLCNEAMTVNGMVEVRHIRAALSGGAATSGEETP